MKRILILSYYFPPANSVAGFRAHSWCRYFKSCGLFPVVITRHWTGNEKTWQDLMNENRNEVIHELHDDYEIYRLPSRKQRLIRLFENNLFRFTPFRKIVYFLLSFFGRLNLFADAYSAFFPFLKTHLKTEKYDLVLATSPPLNIIRLAFKINNEFGLPYVVDFRDLWNNDLMKTGYRPTGIQKILEARMEYWVRRWMSAALFCTSVSHPISNFLGIVFKGRREVVYNGYEHEIMDSARTIDNDKFTILLAGTYYLQQDLKTLIEGLNLFLKNKNSASVVIRFIGLTVNTDVVRLFKSGIDQAFTEWMERSEMSDAISEIKSADVLVHSAWKGYKGIYTTKLFDYIGSGNFILLAPGDHDVMDEIVDETGTGKHPDSPEEIAAVLENCYLEWNSNGRVKTTSNKSIEKYTRYFQAKQMANLIITSFNKKV